MAIPKKLLLLLDESYYSIASVLKQIVITVCGTIIGLRKFKRRKFFGGGEQE